MSRCLHLPHTSIPRHVFCHRVLFHVISGVVQTISSWTSPLLLFPCTCVFNIVLVVSPPPRPSLPVAIPSQWTLSGEVAIGSMLASLHMSSFLVRSLLVMLLAHLSSLVSVVCSVCVGPICFLDCPAFLHVDHCWRL